MKLYIRFVRVAEFVSGWLSNIMPFWPLGVIRARTNEADSLLFLSRSSERMRRKIRGQRADADWSWPIASGDTNPSAVPFARKTRLKISRPACMRFLSSHIYFPCFIGTSTDEHALRALSFTSFTHRILEKLLPTVKRQVWKKSNHVLPQLGNGISSEILMKIKMAKMCNIYRSAVHYNFNRALEKRIKVNKLIIQIGESIELFGVIKLVVYVNYFKLHQFFLLFFFNSHSY